MERNKIVYAEDNEMMRTAVEDFLERQFSDYEIELHKDGNFLKNRLEQDIGDVALIVTDNSMGPGPSGFQIIKDYAKTKDVPFILLYGDDAMIGKHAVKEGAFGYVVKPDIEELRFLMDKALQENK